MPTYIADAISQFFSLYGSLLLLAAILIGMVTFTIISQKKQQKKITDMLDSLKAGDRVRTVGGFFGTVESIEGDVVILKVNPHKKRIAISKRAVAVVGDSDVENTIDDMSK